MLNVKRCFLGLLLLLSLNACKSETIVLATTAPPTLLRIVVTETPVPTVTQTTIPTATTIPSPVPTQFNTPTAVPVQLEVIAGTPTPRPVPSPTSSTLPTWIAEPSANILLLIKIKNPIVVLYNVATGEQHEIRMNVDDPSPNWQWQEGRYLLSFEKGKTQQAMIDIVTGERLNVSKFNQGAFSPNGRYEIFIANQEDKSDLVTILDHETQTKTELLNPFRNFQSLDESFSESATAFWSPDGALLAVLYIKWYSSGNSDYNLVIYTPSGKIFRQYENVAPSRWNNPWNPVLPYRILYTGNSYNLPCILNVSQDTKTCLNEIAEWANDQNVVLFNYTWSPDGKRISYVYGGSDLPNTGLCYVELATKNRVCPITTEDLKVDEQLFARIQFWSPDGKYLVLFFDRFGFMDVVGDTNVAIVDVDNQTFQILPGKYSWPFDNPWRPPIP